MGLPSTLDCAVGADFVGCADGWAGWQAETGEHGVVVTSPIVLGASAALRVNIEQRTPGAGSARVELRHAANGTAIPDFEMATCRPIVADSSAAAVAQEPSQRRCINSIESGFEQWPASAHSVQRGSRYAARMSRGKSGGDIDTRRYTWLAT